MNRLYFSLLFLLLSCTVFAQREYMKYMGIPLNGSITNFQQKLEAKGVKLNKVVNSKVAVGTRVFKGPFSGENADVYVYYNEKTKIVYRAKAVIEYPTKDIGERNFEKFSSMLKEKYLSGVVKDGEQEGHPALCMRVLDNNFEFTIGFVSMYISDANDYFDEHVYLHIDYEDEANSQSDKHTNMDDL